MSDLTPSEETAYGIIGMLGNDSRFKSRLDELVKARQDAEAAAAKIEEVTAKQVKTKAETDTYVNGKKAELAVAQKKHDTAAQEAADRLRLGEAQMAEVLRVKTENENTAKALAAKEKELAGREHILKDQLAGVAALRSTAERGADLVKRQLAHIAAMPKQ